MLNRRSLLKLIGLAPVAAPVIAAVEAPAYGFGQMSVAEGCMFAPLSAGEKASYGWYAADGSHGMLPTGWEFEPGDYLPFEQAQRVRLEHSLPAVLPYHAEMMVV